jgi:hypothetical protein
MTLESTPYLHKESQMSKKKHILPTVACKVSRGMFSTEREIFIQGDDGSEVTALVDQSSVIEPKQPAPGESIDGRVKVSVVEIDNKSGFALVDLPQPAFAVGARIKIPAKLLDL